MAASAGLCPQIVTLPIFSRRGVAISVHGCWAGLCHPQVCLIALTRSLCCRLRAPVECRDAPFANIYSRRTLLPHEMNMLMATGRLRRVVSQYGVQHRSVLSWLATVPAGASSAPWMNLL